MSKEIRQAKQSPVHIPLGFSEAVGELLAVDPKKPVDPRKPVESKKESAKREPVGPAK